MSVRYDPNEARTEGRLDRVFWDTMQKEVSEATAAIRDARGLIIRLRDQSQPDSGTYYMCESWLKRHGNGK